MNDLWIHVPTPGDHYSPMTGSALITIIHETSRAHENRGGRTRVVVGRGTRHDYPDDEHFEVDFGPQADKKQKIADAALGRLGLPRAFGPRQYAPLLEGVERDFIGPLFVHNNPVALRLLARERPRARVCLWANNEIWRPYGRAEMRRIEREVHRLICCSQFIADQTNARLGFQSPKVKVVVSGVNTEKFVPRPELRDEQTPVILYAGRMLEIKGPHLLIEAAKNLGNRRFKLRIVGSRMFNPSEPLTEYEQKLRELAAPLGEKIEFVPSVDRFRMIEEYQSASIFCAPAIWNEPLGLTISEAMSCGLPTVTTRRGGIPESGAQAALYFEPERPQTLVETLADLLDHPEKRALAGEKSRARALEISWENQYETLKNAL